MKSPSRELRRQWFKKKRFAIIERLDMEDLKLFLEFGKSYFVTKIVAAGRNFEAGKDIIVAFLTIKRGRYSSSFLNTSFFLIVLRLIWLFYIHTDINFYLSAITQKDIS